MTGTWATGPLPNPPVVTRLVATTCDRCGRPSTIIGHSHARAWGEAVVQIQGGTSAHADLCAACSVELHAWIDAGVGGGMQDEIAYANEAREAVMTTTTRSPPKRVPRGRRP